MCLCDFSAFYSFRFFLVLRCCRCSHPAQASGANPDHTSRSQQQQQNKCYQQKPASSAEPASPAKPGTASIIGTTRRIQQNQHHMQTRASPAEANVTSRSHHNQHHQQDQTRQAEPADASIGSRASFTSRTPPQNQHQSQKPAPLAKTGRNKFGSVLKLGLSCLGGWKSKQLLACC